MANDREQWKLWADRHVLIRESYAPDLQYNLQMASDTSKLLLNVLFILNGGGLVALATLTERVDPSSIIRPAFIFVTGLFFALVTGLLTIWNFRSLAKEARLRRDAELWRHNEEYAARTQSVEFKPSDDLKQKQDTAESYGKHRIRWTNWPSWICAFLSGVAFILGASWTLWVR